MPETKLAFAVEPNSRTRLSSITCAACRPALRSAYREFSQGSPSCSLFRHEESRCWIQTLIECFLNIWEHSSRYAFGSKSPNAAYFAGHVKHKLPSSSLTSFCAPYHAANCHQTPSYGAKCNSELGRRVRFFGVTLAWKIDSGWTLETLIPSFQSEVD